MAMESSPDFPRSFAFIGLGAMGYPVSPPVSFTAAQLSSYFSHHFFPRPLYMPYTVVTFTFDVV